MTPLEITIQLIKRKTWNDAVKATLIEIRKYDGMLSIGDREYITTKISKKLFVKGFKHNFKKLQA